MPHFPLYNVACSQHLSFEVICAKFYSIVDCLYYTTTTTSTTVSFIWMTIQYSIAFNCINANFFYKISGEPQHELRGKMVSQLSHHSSVFIQVGSALLCCGRKPVEPPHILWERLAPHRTAWLKEKNDRIMRNSLSYLVVSLQHKSVRIDLNKSKRLS